MWRQRLESVGGSVLYLWETEQEIEWNPIGVTISCF